MTAAGASPRDRRALVAVDLGAQSCRVSLLQFGGAGPRARLVHRFANAPVAVANELVWPFASIEAGVVEGLRRCAALAPEGIRSIAVDGWAVDYVRLAPDGAALAPPFCYRDERTVAAEAAVHAEVPGSTLRTLTGVQIQRINTAYQLVADRMAGLAPAPWLNLPEYLLTRLGARPVAEITNASHTQLVAIHTSGWSDEAFRLLHLEKEMAASIVAPGTVIGQLRHELATLPAFRDTLLIAPACHDTASAIAGVTAPQHAEPYAYISSGTWSLVGTLLHAPENGDAACAGNYTNLAAAGGRTLFHKGLHGMWLLRQCQLHWEQETGGSSPVELSTLIEAAATVPPPAHCLDVEDPELLLPGDMPARISAHLARRGCAPLPRTRQAAPQYASLIFHSLAARYATLVRELQDITGKRFTRIHVVGGGSRNTLLNGLVETATGLPVIAGAPESSTLGNFAVQLAALEDGAANSDAISDWAFALQRSFADE